MDLKTRRVWSEAERNGEMARNKLVYRVENFCAVNKYVIGGAGIALASIGLGLHFLQRGLYEQGTNKYYETFLRNG